MSDTQKLDEYFNNEPPKSQPRDFGDVSKHTRFIHLAKLVLPGVATILISLLLIIPNLTQKNYDLKFDITKPKSGELEKLHMEKTVFYITDKNNQVNNFTAENIDETAPGSKLIKLNHPEGILPSAQEAWVNIKSPTGYYNQNDNTLQLTDNVELFYSEGMNINVFDVNFDFKTSHGHSDSAVTGQGVFGDVQAEGFDFYSDTGIFTFNGKTNLKIKEESFKRNN